MKTIAITGGIGSGKSTIRKMFEELGAVGVDADELARQVVEPGSEGARRIREAFGSEFFDAHDRLDRSKMAAKVFNDPESRREIEKILHPLIREAEGRIVVEARRKDPGALVVVEIPLLAEGGRSGEYSGVVLVKAPEEVRISRLVHSGKYSEEEAAARIASQAGDEDRERVADWIVDNGRDPDASAGQVKKIYAALSG